MSLTLRDILAEVLTGSTLNVTTATATDMLNVVVDNSGANPALRVSGISGTGGSGTSGKNGTNGTSGTSGVGSPGTSGTSGVNGNVGSSGTSGVGSPGTSGTSGANGVNGTAGNDGTSGTSGNTGTSGTSGIGIDGSSGTSGKDGGGSANYTPQFVSQTSFTGTTSIFYRCSGVTEFCTPDSGGDGAWLLIKNVDDATLNVHAETSTIDYLTNKNLNAHDSILLIAGDTGNWDIS